MNTFRLPMSLLEQDEARKVTKAVWLVHDLHRLLCKKSEERLEERLEEELVCKFKEDIEVHDEYIYTNFFFQLQDSIGLMLHDSPKVREMVDELSTSTDLSQCISQCIFWGDNTDPVTVLSVQEAHTLIKSKECTLYKQQSDNLHKKVCK